MPWRPLGTKVGEPFKKRYGADGFAQDIYRFGELRGFELIGVYTMVSYEGYYLR